MSGDMKDVIDVSRVTDAGWNVQQRDNFRRHREYARKVMLPKFADANGELGGFPTEWKHLEGENELRARMSKELILCLLSELSETLDRLPWKHWKDYSKFQVDKTELLFELVDIMHFVQDILFVWGIPFEDFERAFALKLEENERRQREGY